MSALVANPETRDSLWNFSARMTWVISPTGLREKAQREAEYAVDHPWRTSDRPAQISVKQRFTAKEKNRHGLADKGEGRAKTPCGGLRKVSSARQNRKPTAAQARIPRLAMLLFALTVLIVAVPALAATHPVPLEPNTETRRNVSSATKRRPSARRFTRQFRWAA